MSSPIDFRRLFATPWEGEGEIWRPRWLRWLPGPEHFRFRSEIANVAGHSWDIVDTTFRDGSVRRRHIRARALDPTTVELTAEDMPRGARVHARADGFDFEPYVIRTPVFGRLRVPLRYLDQVRLTDDGAMVDTIELRALGVLVARITIRLRPI